MRAKGKTKAGLAKRGSKSGQVQSLNSNAVFRQMKDLSEMRSCKQPTNTYTRQADGKRKGGER